MKPILVVTHERSGTHLMINMINFQNNGDFSAIGKLPYGKKHNTKTYRDYVYKYIVMNMHTNFDLISKSHHQFGFYEDFKDFLFDNYKIIYVKRDIKDTLLSYYRFLSSDNYIPLKDFPKLEDWVFSNPTEIGYKFFADTPDPHIIIEPKDYIDRILIHQEGWMKYEDNLLVINYEDIVNNYEKTKVDIEDYLCRKISNDIPNVNDKNLPNFVPNKGLVGEYEDFMNDELIKKINLNV